jgi:hypothetical protein
MLNFLNKITDKQNSSSATKLDTSHLSSMNCVITTIRVAPHPNADKLQLGYVNNVVVIVGLEVKSGDLGVFFEDGCQLSESFCAQHDLISRKDEEGNKVGGYFSENRRVRVQGFRGVKSSGYWVPLSWLSYTGYNISKLREGDQFFELNKVHICNKYYNKETLRKLNNLKSGPTKVVVELPEHDKTTQFTFASIPKGSIIHITLKVHGTSWRYGLVNSTTPLSAQGFIGNLKNKLNSLLRKPLFKSKSELSHHLGARRTILKKTKAGGFTGGFYGDGQPYSQVSTLLEGKIKEQEVLYGEVSGYCPNGEALFKHSTKDYKDLTKLYGSNFDYSYGCAKGQSIIHVYRITQHGVELSWQQVKQRCIELGVNYVPEILTLVYDGDRKKLDDVVDSMLEGPDPIDNRHPKEGVCIRVENTDGTKIWKAKSYTFKLLEGIMRDDETTVDIEEVS